MYKQSRSTTVLWKKPLNWGTGSWLQKKKEIDLVELNLNEDYKSNKQITMLSKKTTNKKIKKLSNKEISEIKKKLRRKKSEVSKKK